MIAITGATGKLGRHVLEEMLRTQPSNEVVAIVRNPAKAADLTARGIQVRIGDYSKPESLPSALAGVTKLLLISSSEVGRRAVQHKAVIEAARNGSVDFIAYTSILRADTSGLVLAEEHRITEQAIRASGLQFALLRNGWYLENFTENLAPALQYGALMGSAGSGRFAAASRADYAGAAATVMTHDGHQNQTYELAGDTSFTLTELAAKLSKLAGKEIVYKNLPPAEYQKSLEGFGIPENFAKILVDSDLGAAKGELDSDSKDLRNLIGRPTTTIESALTVALQSRTAQKRF